jgi:hypothetical protein
MRFSPRQTETRRAEHRENDDSHLRVLIEQMSRDSCSEREIVAAVKRTRGGGRGR